jgi:peptidoglycan/LPS O-acetylase OafA/YrhL
MGVDLFFHLDRHPTLALPLGIVAAYALATLSWQVLEKPFLALKRFFAPEPKLPETRQTFRSEEMPVHG